VPCKQLASPTGSPTLTRSKIETREDGSISIRSARGSVLVTSRAPDVFLCRFEGHLRCPTFARASATPKEQRRNLPSPPAVRSRGAPRRADDRWRQPRRRRLRRPESVEGIGSLAHHSRSLGPGAPTVQRRYVPNRASRIVTPLAPTAAHRNEGGIGLRPLSNKPPAKTNTMAASIEARLRVTRKDYLGSRVTTAKGGGD
jgi:hypothetical protein